MNLLARMEKAKTTQETMQKRFDESKAENDRLKVPTVALSFVPFLLLCDD